MLTLCLLTASLPALRSDIQAEQTQNVNQLAAATPTAVAGCYTNCNGASPRVANFGHSIAWGWNCSNVGSDGYRAPMVAQLCLMGGPIPGFVGSQTVPSSGSVLGCPKTDAAGSQKIADTYASIAAIPTVMPTPTSNDWVIIGPALTNNAAAGDSLATMEAGMKACITRTASYGPAKIWVVNDYPRNDGVSLTNALQAASNAYTWALGQGYNVGFINVNSWTSASDICGDNVHPNPAGYQKMGVGMAISVKSQLP